MNDEQVRVEWSASCRKITAAEYYREGEGLLSGSVLVGEGV